MKCRQTPLRSGPRSGADRPSAPRRAGSMATQLPGRVERPRTGTSPSRSSTRWTLGVMWRAIVPGARPARPATRKRCAALVVREPQRPGQCGEHQRRGMGGAALLQARRGSRPRPRPAAATSSRRRPGARRRPAAAARPRRASSRSRQRAGTGPNSSVHASHDARRSAGSLVLASPRIARPLADPPAGGTRWCHDHHTHHRSQQGPRVRDRPPPVAEGHDGLDRRRDLERGRAAAERARAPASSQLDVTDDASVGRRGRDIEADGGSTSWSTTPASSATARRALDTTPRGHARTCTRRTSSASSASRTPSCRCSSAPPPPSWSTCPAAWARSPSTTDPSASSRRSSRSPTRPPRPRVNMITVAVREGVPGNPDQRRRPRLHRDRPQRPRGHPDRRGGRRGDRADGERSAPTARPGPSSTGRAPCLGEALRGGVEVAYGLVLRAAASSTTPLLGETIGANLERTVAALRRPRGARLRPPGRCGSPTRSSTPPSTRWPRGLLGLGVGEGRPGRDLEPEPRRVGAHPVRDREGRRDPRQRQPGLPHLRARVRPQPVGLPRADRRAGVQDLRLRGDGRARSARRGLERAVVHGLARVGGARGGRGRAGSRRGARPRPPGSTSTTRSTSSTRAARPASRRARRSPTTTSSTTASSSARRWATPRPTGSASPCRSTTASGW